MRAASSTACLAALLLFVTNVQAWPKLDRRIIASCPGGKSCCAKSKGNGQCAVPSTSSQIRGPTTTVTTYVHTGTADQTITDGSTLIIETLVENVTSTTTLATNANDYMSVYKPSNSASPWTIVYGQPAKYTSTSYLHGGASAPFTTTIGNEVVLATPVPTTTIFSTLAAGSAPFTRTAIGSGSEPDTVVYGSALPYVTSVVYDHQAGAMPFVQTSLGTIYMHAPASTTTVMTAASTAGPLTTSYGTGSNPDTVYYGTTVPAPGETTSYDHNAGATDRTLTSTGSGTTEIIDVIARTTVTLTTTGAPTDVVTTSTQIIPASGSQAGTIRYIVRQAYPTSYYYSTGTVYTTTDANGATYVASPVPTLTRTSTLPNNASAYTSSYAASGSRAGSVIYGNPAQPEYTTTTSYIHGSPSGTPFVVTSGSLIIFATPATVTTMSTQVPAGQPGGLSTKLGTGSDPDIVYSAVTQAYSVSTTYLHGASATPFTATSSNSLASSYLVVGTPVQTTTRTTTLASGTAFTSTYINNGSSVDSVIVGLPYAQSVTYEPGPSASSYVETKGATIITHIPQQTISTTIALSANTTPYTSTDVQSTPAQSVVTITVATPRPYSRTTEYDEGGSSQYTVTQGETQIVHVPQSTLTQYTTLPAGASAYVTTLNGGQTPAAATKTIVMAASQSYALSTEYDTTSGASAYQTMQSGTIVDHEPQKTTTVTSTLSAYANGFTSTEPQSTPAQATRSVTIGSPRPFALTTVYDENGTTRYTTATGETEVVHVPQVTTTSYTTLPAGASAFVTMLSGNSTAVPATKTILSGATQAYAMTTTYVAGPSASPSVATSAGTIIVYSPQATVTSTTKLAPGQVGYTSAGLQTVSELPPTRTIYVGVTTAYAQSTVYETGSLASAFAITSGGTIIYHLKQVTVTFTSMLSPGQSGYTSFEPQPSNGPGATQVVDIGITTAYGQSTVYESGPTASSYAVTGTDGVITNYIPQATVTQTSTLSAGASGYTSIPSPSDIGNAATVTELVGLTRPYGASTTYVTEGSESLATTNGTIVHYEPQSTTTILRTGSPGESGYTSLDPQSTSLQAVRTVTVQVTQAYSRSTTYIESGSESFVTSSGTIVDYVPQVTTTLLTTLSPGGSGYSTFEVQSTPLQPTRTAYIGVSQAYAQTITYVTGLGSTVTSSGTIYNYLPQATFTASTTLPPGSSGYTSLDPQSLVLASVRTEFIGITKAYGQSTTYVTGSGSVATSGGTVINYIPQVTTTRFTTLMPGENGYSSLDPQSMPLQATRTANIAATQAYSTGTTYITTGDASTVTLGPSIIYYVPQRTVTLTTTLSAGAASYSSLEPLSTPVQATRTLVTGTDLPYDSSTTYITSGALSIATVRGTIIQYIPESSTTITSTLATGATGYTSTAPLSTPAQATRTITIGYAPPYVSSTTYITSGAPSSSTISGTIVQYIPQVSTTVTTTLMTGAAGYTSTQPLSTPVQPTRTVTVATAPPYVTSTTYVTSGQGSIATVAGGTIVNYIPQVSTTITSTLSGAAGYTSTQSQSTPIQPTRTITIGSAPAPVYVTTTTYGSFASATTIPYSGNVPGTVITQKSVVYVTSTSTGSAAATLLPPASQVTGATATVTVVYPTPSSCNNQGLQWAYDYNPFKNTDSTGNPAYTNFNAAYFKTATPQTSGVTSVTGFDHPALTGSATVYGSANQYPFQYFALNHRGYIYAKESGTYTFSAEADDIALFWVGPAAYSGWTRANALLDVSVNYGTITTTMTLVQGLYYPFRILYGNGQGSASLGIKVTAPDGTELFGSSSVASPYLVQYSCDGVTAPKYPAYGQET